ncbi:hypothetical protein [Streptomyces fragilis]|uniref:hypothetical protein n=1 Tax=Streptomyces fragilis TaxID=67301 RepID=UPI0024DEF58F|nr:hypothetical protein [Streptomyces fragilis]
MCIRDRLRTGPGAQVTSGPVSYTHLDVYKRQAQVSSRRVRRPRSAPGGPGGPGQLRTGPGARDSSGRVRGPGQGPGLSLIHI